MALLRVFKAAIVALFLSATFLSGPVAAMGIPLGSPTKPKGPEAFMAEVFAALIRNSFGYLVNPQSETLQDVEMRRAMLDLVNREAFLALWSKQDAFQARYDLGSVYQSAFGFGWDSSAPLSAQDWRRVTALVPDITYDNVPYAYSVKKADRLVDRRTLRSMYKVMQAQGYVLKDDGLLYTSQDKALSLRVVSRPAPMVEPAINVSLQQPLERLGVRTSLKVLTTAEAGWGMRNGAFDVFVTTGATSSDFARMANLFATAPDIAKLVAALNEKAKQHYDRQAGSAPAQALTLADVLAYDTPLEREIYVLLRALDHVLINQAYFLPVAYQCESETVICKFPN